MRAATAGSLLGLAIAAGGCRLTEDLKDAIPVVKLQGLSAPVEIHLGDTRPVFVQALDADSLGVNSAEIVFARQDADRIFFDGAGEDVDAVTVKTGTRDVSGLALEGAALVQIRTKEGATPGDTVMIAVAKEPTADPAAALVVRIQVRVLAPVDAGAPEDVDAGMADATADATGGEK